MGVQPEMGWFYPPNPGPAQCCDSKIVLIACMGAASQYCYMYRLLERGGRLIAACQLQLVNCALVERRVSPGLSMDPSNMFDCAKVGVV